MAGKTENENLLLNISPRGDGSIPDEQQAALAGIGEWLRVNGEGIYGTRAWMIFGEGPLMPTEAPGDWNGGSTDRPGPHVAREALPEPTEADFRFTAGRNAVYAFGYKRPAQTARLRSFAEGKAKVQRVTLLGEGARLQFVQTHDALEVTMPAGTPEHEAYCLRIEGSVPLGGVA